MKLIIDADVLADFVSALLGPDSEIAVHDLSNPAASLRIIRNGALSGRDVGAPATDLALRMAQECSGEDGGHFRINYRSKTANGQSLRSSTLVFKDEGGQVRAMFCVNTDDSRYRRAWEAVQALLPEDLSHEGHQENLSASVDDVGLHIMQTALEQFDVDPKRLSAEEKAQVVQELDERGLFSIRGFVARAAQTLDISEPTLYRYLKQNRD
ncbi:MAG: PAS domain-containing protein [Paludibacterium sp.]|uniref:helix-turn-helix transcriptional regulator n=1 Tax=Paludibacterium sp. TaxID=1917523 RepID=UPI0025CE45DC|nr:PAS domain-containing protein [Paludibacterium sp.]MBV8046233.1 PAS domain-containing protein [Paludibacterium sp.]MBV8649447.1 PAS domain-containing protein [Paludibacterium sp.]